MRAKVVDIPIKSIYQNEKSNINILLVFIKFPILYCLRNPDMKFLSFIFGILSIIFGVTFSLNVWKTGVEDVPSSSGTVSIALISLLIGINFVSYFFMSDINNDPKNPILTI